MNERPEVIRHGRCGRVLRIHGERNEVKYLVMAQLPEQRRRFRRPEQAIDYLMQLERRERVGEQKPAVEVGESRRSWLGKRRRRAGEE